MLQATLAVCLLTATAVARPDPFELVKVADGVYAAVARPWVPMNSNAAVIVNDTDVLVVDSHGTPAAAEALVRQIRKLTPLPVRTVVNTHAHGDHVRGNPAYARAPHEIAIVSTAAARAKLAADEPRQLADEARTIGGKIEAARAAWKAARTPDAEQKLRDLERYGKQLQTMKVALPTLTFDRTLVLHRGAREIFVMFLGRGHTDGDAVVYLPKEKVVVTGDLVSAWGPGMGDGHPNEWPATLDALAKLEIQTVIGGHGPPGGKEMITKLRAYVVDLLAEVRAVVARGGTEEDAVRAVAERVVPKHRASFAEGEFEPRAPGNAKKVYADMKAGRYQ